jgi:Domain of unknown function (DUF3291)
MTDPDRYHLAQINVARMLHPLDHLRMAGFVRRLERINALADVAPGFVWRLRDESGNATGLKPFPEPRMLVNMSVWRSIEALFAFVYRSAHTEPLRLRKASFEKPAEAHMALWWLPAGTLPTVAEGRERFEHLRRHGPAAEAFTFKQRYPAPRSLAA